MRKSAFLLAFALVTPGLATPKAAMAAGFGLGSLYSCDAAGSRNTTGAVIGGLLGGLAGSQISRNERVLGAVAGAAVGSAIGNSIGCKMDRSARDRAQNAFQRALDTGQPQSWSDQASGASGYIEVLDVPQAQPDRPWRFAQNVAVADRIGGPTGHFEADSRARVRAAPSEDAEAITRLQAGERVFVAGEARPGWLAIADDDGVIQGYVSVSSMRPLDVQQAAGNGCRTVAETVTLRGSPPTTTRYSACRDERGAWQLNQI